VGELRTAQSPGGRTKEKRKGRTKRTRKENPNNKNMYCMRGGVFNPEPKADHMFESVLQEKGPREKRPQDTERTKKRQRHYAGSLIQTGFRRLLFMRWVM
jgi:hypothetical protein